MGVGILFGYLSAIKAGVHRRHPDHPRPDRDLAPVFFLGAFFLYYFTFKWKFFRRAGTCRSTQDPWGWFTHLLLPWICLAILYVGFYSRLLRSNMLDAMNEDYVRTAKAKGLSERQVRIHHVLRLSLIPIITLFGLDFGALSGRRDHHRNVFSLNGVGGYAFDAVAHLDLPPLMAVTMFGAFLIVLFNTWSISRTRARSADQARNERGMTDGFAAEVQDLQVRS